jgi:hypothetical protein
LQPLIKVADKGAGGADVEEGEGRGGRGAGETGDWVASLLEIVPVAFEEGGEDGFSFTGGGGSDEKGVTAV